MWYRTAIAMYTDRYIDLIFMFQRPGNILYIYVYNFLSSQKKTGEREKYELLQAPALLLVFTFVNERP